MDVTFNMFGKATGPRKKPMDPDFAKDNIRVLLDLLPEDQREVIILRMYADLSFKEIAALTNKPIGQAQKEIKAGLESLRKIMGVQPKALKTLTSDPSVLQAEVRIFSSVSTNLIEAIAKNKEVLWSISSRQFEELTAEILYRHGFEVELTPPTRDGGTDIIARSHNAISSNVWFVECKHHSLHRPVGINIFRQVYGTHEINKPNKSIIVTSSYFTEGVKKAAQELKNIIDLKDHVQVLKWVEEL